MKNRYILATSMALLLGGCGGGDDSALPVQNSQPKAGELLSATTKVDGIEVIKETYRYYAVDDSGRLVAEAKPENENAPHISLLESRQISPLPVMSIQAMAVQTDNLEPINMADTQAFVENLLAALRVHYPNLSKLDLMHQLGDYDQSLEDLRADQMKSGLGSLKEFVEFYEAIDLYLNNENDEAQADHFLELSGLNVGQFLTLLEKSGVTWAELLAAMKSQNIGFTSLYNLYASSLESLEVFIPNFVRGKSAATPMLLASLQVGSAAGVAVDAGKLGLKVAKFAWEIIKDNRPTTTAEGAYTSVLSIKDDSYENYGYSTPGSSSVIDFHLENLYNFTIIQAKFKVEGYYKAANPKVPGYWMPSIAFKVDEAYAAFTFNVNAGAAITSAANMASPSAPEPEIQIVAKVTGSGLFQSYVKSYTFYANGRTGFKKG